VDEASNFGLPVAAHLGLTDAVTAGQLGVTSIEHLTGVPEAASPEKERAKFFAAHQQGFFAGWNYFERSWAKLDSAQIARVAEQLATTGVVMVPTLVLHETLSRLDDPALLLDPGLKAVPDTELARWNLPDLKARAGWTEADYAAFRASRGNQDLFIREFLASGGTVVTGSDASNQMLVPGLSEHTELLLLVEAGLTPSEALKAATRNAAGLLKADSLGVIAAGKSADLVVLRGDPLQDIKNTRSVEWVMVRGALMSADSIRAGW
jgi:imidazolonepropionase-like amidohydrolase